MQFATGGISGKKLEKVVKVHHTKWTIQSASHKVGHCKVAWNSRYNISSDWQSWILPFARDILWDIFKDTCKQLQVEAELENCEKVPPWKLGINWLSFWPLLPIAEFSSTKMHSMTSVQILCSGKNSSLENFDISGNRCCVNLANSQSWEIRSRLHLSKISLFINGDILDELWYTFRMDFSFLTCSICLSLITSWMARILRAKYSRLERSRHKQTRAKVPA